MITQQIKIFGRVQGVGYRKATVKLAQQFDVTGTVENKEDFVEVHVTGEPDEVQRFREQVVKGPAPFSKVSSFVVNELSPQSFEGFKQV